MVFSRILAQMCTTCANFPQVISRFSIKKHALFLRFSSDFSNRSNSLLEHLSSLNSNGFYLNGPGRSGGFHIPFIRAVPFCWYFLFTCLWLFTFESFFEGQISSQSLPKKESLILDVHNHETISITSRCGSVVTND